MEDAKRKTQKNRMLGKRIISSLLIAIVGFFLLFAGGWIYTVGIGLILCAAAWEFIRMFAGGDHDPNPYPAIIGTFLITLAHNLSDERIALIAFILTIFSISILKIIQYQRTKETAAIDLIIELTALVFITFPGIYLINIRMLPQGLFWTMISILTACSGDIGAYVIGSLFGKHKMAPMLSPKKTIEGYIGGIITAAITGFALGLIIRRFTPQIPLFAAILIGSIVGISSPLGDLSKSIIKRHFALQDTGSLIPGHGGILDRVDTWLWAAPISYFLIICFFL